MTRDMTNLKTAMQTPLETLLQARVALFCRKSGIK